MLDRIVASIAMALFAWLEKRIERPNVSVDLAMDRARLLRAGSRLRAWMRRENGLREGRLPGQDLKGEGNGSGSSRRILDRNFPDRAP